MPNICTNTIHITGDKEKVNKLLDLCTTEVQENYGSDTLVKAIDLTISRPQPVEYDYIHTGGTTINGESVSRWKSKDTTTGEFVVGYGFDSDNIELVKVEQEELDLLQEKYGAKDWYDWRLNNWGTKWITPINIDHIAKWESDNVIILELETESAWGPPYELLNFLTSEFDLNINNRWWEEGGNTGWDYYDTEE